MPERLILHVCVRVCLCGPVLRVWPGPSICHYSQNDLQNENNLVIRIRRIMDAQRG